jgi:hypothetical protein
MTDPALPPDFDDLLNQAQAMTDKEFSDMITSFTKLTPHDLNDLNLTAADKQQLAILIGTVRSKANSNDILNSVLGILGTVGSVVIKLALKALL